jgi:pimeloyl-ACP methyl ester carboxylesterase
MNQDEISVTVAGTPVRAYRAGAGPALVLLHGGGLDDAQLTWAPVWAQLTPHAQVIAPDLPGFGGSPLGPTVATLEGYRAWLVEFLDACQFDRVILAGLSLGGGIAPRTALDEPDRLRALALIAPYGVSPRLPGGKTGYFSVHTPGVAGFTDAVLRHSDRLLRTSLRALLHRPDAVTQELVTQVRALLTQPDAGAAWSTFQHHEVEWAGPRTYFGDHLAGIACPALLLSGEQDKLVPPDDVRAAATRIPGARFVLVAGAGHWLPRDAPDQVAEQLIGVLPPANAAPGPSEDR